MSRSTQPVGGERPNGLCTIPDLVPMALWGPRLIFSEGGGPCAIVRCHRSRRAGCQDPHVRHRTPRLLLATSVVVVAALAGCSGSDGGDAAPTTTTVVPADATTALSPDEAFDETLTEQLEGLDAAFIGGSRAAGHTLCGNLTAVTADPDEDDPVSELTPEVLIGAVVDGFSQPAVAAVVLRATGEHYCPEHADAIEAVLSARGL
jgi:hypothetical protein